MIGHMRHGSPPRLLPLQSILSHNRRESLPTPSAGVRMTGRIWTYVRDDRPFGSRAPPAALYYVSRDRAGEHPERHLCGFSGILQADAYSGYNRLYDPARAPGALTPAFSGRMPGVGSSNWPTIAANARRGKKAAVISPIALEAVQRIDALFEIERS